MTSGSLDMTHKKQFIAYRLTWKQPQLAFRLQESRAEITFRLTAVSTRISEFVFKTNLVERWKLSVDDSEDSKLALADIVKKNASSRAFARWFVYGKLTRHLKIHKTIDTTEIRTLIEKFGWQQHEKDIIMDFRLARAHKKTNSQSAVIGRFGEYRYCLTPWYLLNDTQTPEHYHESEWERYEYAVTRYWNSRIARVGSQQGLKELAQHEVNDEVRHEITQTSN